MKSKDFNQQGIGRSVPRGTPSIYLIYSHSGDRKIYIGESWNLRAKLTSHCMKLSASVACIWKYSLEYFTFLEIRGGGVTIGLCGVGVDQAV